MGHADPHVAGLDLRVRETLGDGVDWCRDQSCALSTSNHSRLVRVEGISRQRVSERINIRQAQLQRGEARISGEIGTIEDLAERGEELNSTPPAP